MRLDIDLAALHRGVDRPFALSGMTDGLRRADAGNRSLFLYGEPRDATSGVRLDPADLLSRYVDAGEDVATFPSGLHGTYAIAVVDGAARRALLCNDRLSIRGWCHAQSDGVLRIAPRADSLGDSDRLDPQALFTYLFNHVIPSPDTVFHGVKRLPPGHLLLARHAATTVRPHWQPAFAEPGDADFAALRDEFRALVRTSVAREWEHARGRPIGTFLSGGTDSSTVSGMLRAVAGAPTRAYSIGFDAEGYDEMAYARLAARHFGLTHREHYLTPDEVAEAMPRVAGYYDQPFGNSSAVAAFCCARFAFEDGSPRLLAGDGGDELFGGNSRYARHSLFDRYEAIPRPLRSWLVEPLLDNPVAERIPGVSKVASYVRQARVPMPDRLHLYDLLVRLGADQVLEPAFLAQVDPSHDRSQQRETYRRAGDAHPVNRLLAYDWKYTLADNDLPKVGGTSALAGVEAAFPLLSDDIIDFSLRLPAAYKLKGLKLRWFFKEALRGFLPDDILSKKKQGFGLPFGVWALRHERLMKIADDALGSLGTRGLIAPAFLRRLRHELLPAHPRYYGELVWILAMLELWVRRYAPRFELNR